MKKLVGSVVVLLILILGSYYATGLVTEKTLRNNVNLINQNNGLYVGIEQYDRGWFTSTALFKWRLHVPERVVKSQDGKSSIVPAQNYSMDMPLTVYHGPIIFSDRGLRFGLGYAHTALQLPQPFASQFSSMFNSQSTQPKLNVSVLVNYLNRSRFRIDLPSFTLIAKNGDGQFEWLGMTSDVTISSDLDKVDGDLIINGMRIMKENMNAVVGKITSDYNLHEAKEGLYLGEASFSFPSMIISNNNQKVFELLSLEAYTSSDIDDDLFHSFLKTSLEKVVVNGKTYGPGLFKMSIKNLDANVLAQLNQQANKAQQGSSQERQRALLGMLPELPKLLNKGPEFEISEASFVMPEGKLEGYLKIALPKSEATNPFQMIQQVEGNGRLQVPAAVLKNILTESAKQQLLKQPALSQAIAAQMKQQQMTGNSQTQDDSTQNVSSAQEDQAPKSDNTSAEPQTLTLADIKNRATAQAEQKISSMLQSGLLKSEGNTYVVEVKLANGQLTINGQPFSPAMMKF